jgi:putative endonuclease
MDDRQETGRVGEETAAQYLERAGWTLLARNVRYRCGELDVVADDGEQLVFVEVRSRGRARLLRPEDTVRHPKRTRLVRAARLFLARYRGPRRSARFDVIAVDSTERRVLAHHRGAFEARDEEPRRR